MIMTKKSEIYGELTETETGKYMTPWPEEYKYQYCQEYNGERRALVLIETYINYDVITNSLHSPTGDNDHCNYKNGYCQNNAATLIWEPQPLELCHSLKKTRIATNTKITIHSNINGHIRADADELLMTFPSKTETPTQLKGCFPDSELITTPQGIMVKLENCAEYETKKWLIENLMKKHLTQSSANAERATKYMLTYISSTIADEQLKQLEQNNYQNCLLDNHLMFIYRMIANFYPSDVVNYISNTQIALKSKDDILYQIPCKDIEAELMHNMRMDNKFLARPIAMVKPKNGTQYFIQNLHNNQWVKSINLFEKYKKNSEKTYQLDGKYYTFKNYSFIGTEKIPTILLPTSSQTTTTIREIDFSSIETANQEIITDQQLGSMSNAIENLKYFQDKKQVVLGKNTGEDIDIQHTLVATLAGIKSKWFNTILIILNILSTAWALIYPLILIYTCYEVCKHEKYQATPIIYTHVNDQAKISKKSPQETSNM